MFMTQYDAFLNITYKIKKNFQIQKNCHFRIKSGLFLSVFDLKVDTAQMY